MSNAKRILSNAARRTLGALPRISPLFKAARFYVNFYNGDDNENPATNGEWRLLRRVLPRCKIVMDVGANVGLWAQEALRTSPSIELHCFEPAAGAFVKLSSNQFPANVRLNQVALSDSIGQANLFTFGEDAQTNSLYARQHVDWMGESHQQSIQLETLDHYCESNHIDRIDYLKLDTEGHELSVFRGMSNLLDGQRVRFVQFEYGGAYLDAGATLRDITRLMSNRPYRLYKILPTGLLPVPKYIEALETFRLSNWLYVHRDEPEA